MMFIYFLGGKGRGWEKRASHKMGKKAGEKRSKSLNFQVGVLQLYCRRSTYTCGLCQSNEVIRVLAPLINFEGVDGVHSF